jgi:streptogramin lyase
VAVDAAGNLYVADTYNDTIRKVTPDGSVTTLAGSAGINGAADLTGTNALFNQPFGVAVDAAGNVYVADTGNATIRKITPGGVVTTLAGVAGIAGLADSAGGVALFNQPHGLVVDGAGNLFVADTGNAAIRRVATDNTVTTMALTAMESSNTPPPSSNTPPPSSSNTPPPSSGSGSSTSSAGGGGGGGAIGGWFVAALLLLGVGRWVLIGRRWS